MVDLSTLEGYLRAAGFTDAGIGPDRDELVLQIGGSYLTIPARGNVGGEGALLLHGDSLEFTPSVWRALDIIRRHLGT